MRGLGDRWELEARRFNRDAGNFVAPTAREARQVQALCDRLRRGETPAEGAEQLGLEIVDLQDCVLLQEREPARGWGHALFRKNGESGLVVEVPHPLSDYRTPEMGAQIFEATGADVLLVAGANRYNRSEPSPDQPNKRLSDAAHSSATFFHWAHKGALEPGDTVLQIHGFDEEPGDPDAVLSDGQDDQHDPPELLAVERALDAQGLDAWIADFKSPLGKRLGAKTNLQGQQLEPDCRFIHLELSEPVRKEVDPRVIAALREPLAAR